jgi:predicted transcriptional regulator
MASPVTLRLDEETRQRIARMARRRGVSASQVIREAIRDWVEREEATVPYDAIADLVAIVRGGNPHRSSATGRGFRQLLERRGSRR